MTMRTIAYGPAPDQVGDLYLPAASRAPLICLFHGGFWRMPYGRDQLDAMARDLCQSGWAVWNLEYRRVGDGGTPWPATLEDVEAALSLLHTLEADHSMLDLTRLWLLGHSAGGHLAFWAAHKARRLPRPFEPAGAVGLAPLLDLVAAADADLGNGAVKLFLGGDPSSVPERYQLASPRALLPLGVRQWIVHGDLDRGVPIALSRAYAALAEAEGDPVTLVPLPGTNHMALIDPASDAWRAVKACLPSPAAG